MSNGGRKCETSECQNTIDADNKAKRQRFCASCLKLRRADARAAFRDRQARGIPSPKLARGVTTARAWLCEHLLASPCPCGEDRLPCLQLYYREPATPSATRPTVAEMATRGVPLMTLVQAALQCDVYCYNCHAIKIARETHSYRVTFRSSARREAKAPGLGVLAPQPQLSEGSRSVVRQPEVDGASPPQLPANDVAAQATPDQPPDRGSQVDVGDLSATGGPREPVQEDRGGGGVDDAVRAWVGRQAPAQPVDGGVVRAGMRFRRERQR